MPEHVREMNNGVAYDMHVCSILTSSIVEWMLVCMHVRVYAYMCECVYMYVCNNNLRLLIQTDTAQYIFLYTITIKYEGMIASYYRSRI